MITEILANTLSPDQAIREEAVRQLETLENENFVRLGFLLFIKNLLKIINI